MLNIFIFLYLMGQGAGCGAGELPDEKGAMERARRRTALKLMQGKELYLRYCSLCHGEGGRGDGLNAYNLDPKPGDQTDRAFMSRFTDTQLFDFIAGGGRAVRKSALMPAWGKTLKEKEIRDLVAYIRDLSDSRRGDGSRAP